MIYITQLIYIVAGEEDIFDQFEKIAIPTIAKYNGQMLLRIRPAADAFIESHMENPYEVHLAGFETEQDFKHFLEDDERVKFLHLKKQSIRTSILIKGTRI